jgi:hypothetical protein
MSDYKEMEKIAGRHGYYTVYQKKGGMLSEASYVVKKPDGSYSGTFDTFREAVDYAESKAGK